MPRSTSSTLGVEGRIDHIVLRRKIAAELRLIEREEKWQSETTELLPFADTILALNDARMRMEPIDPEKAAATLDKLAAQIDLTRRGVEATAGALPPRPSAPETTAASASAPAARPAGGTTAAARTARRTGGRRWRPRRWWPGGRQLAASGVTDNLPPRRAPRGPVTPIKTTKLVAFRAQDSVATLTFALRGWFDYYQGYDPMFTWWAEAPYKRAAQALDAYRRLLRERVLGIRPGEDEEIVGTPIGREALATDLNAELIAYTPEELLAIGEREYAWCEAEMKKAAKEMGFSDWKDALEKVKTLHVAPGKQTDLIRDQAREAEDYVEKHDLITVPPLAKEVWRMQMMSPERQKVNPFFTGGETISVSFPTDTMDHDDKLMSMRGNNIHFARATVHHELIPGHHLQQFMNARYNTHRARVPHAVLGRRLGALLGDAAVGHGLPHHAREQDRHAVLAHAPGLAHHLLAELPPRELDARTVHRLPRRQGRPRARQRRSGSAPLVQRQLSAALSARLHDGRPAVQGAARRTGGEGQEDDQPPVPRHDHPGREPAGRNGARAPDAAEAAARPRRELEAASAVKDGASAKGEQGVAKAMLCSVRYAGRSR